MGTFYDSISSENLGEQTFTFVSEAANEKDFILAGNGAVTASSMFECSFGDGIPLNKIINLDLIVFH